MMIISTPNLGVIPEILATIPAIFGLSQKTSVVKIPIEAPQRKIPGLIVLGVLALGAVIAIRALGLVRRR